MQVNIHEAKTHFSRLLEQVENGESVVIARSGKPVAKLVPIDSRPAFRKLGLLAGQITGVLDNWTDADQAELEGLFEGSDSEDFK